MTHIAPTGPTLTEGFHEIPAARYHADPCPLPSLSASIARKLIRQSPMHAHFAHPRLGASGWGGSTTAMDDGTIIHELLLGIGDGFAVIDAADYRTKAAQEARDAARMAGQTPVLAGKLDVLHATAAAARKQIEAHPEGRHMFGAGRAEVAMIWREGDTWLRSLVDWLPDDMTAPLMDLKTTGLSAAPGAWERRLITEYALQDAFYARGFRAITGHYPPPMQFVVVETEAPHGVSVMAAAPSLRRMAEAQVEQAIEAWRRCMNTDTWPGYPAFTAYVEAPPWMLMQAEEQALRDEFIEEHAE